MDDVLRELAARVREARTGQDPRAVLDEDALALARSLLVDIRDSPAAPDPDTLHTLAAFFWARSLALGPGERADAELATAIQVFKLLYLVDHRRVPRELWPRFVEETGHDPWRDPLEHAADLVVEAEKSGDGDALDEAVRLVETVADGDDNAYRDTVHGLALTQRAALRDRPAAVREADAAAAVRLLGAVADLPEPSAARRTTRAATYAEALVGRFELTRDTRDLTRAEAAFRDALAHAATSPDVSAARAAAGLGAALGRRVEALDGSPATAPSGSGGGGEESVTLLQEAVRWLRLAVDRAAAPARESYLANLARATGLLLAHEARARRATAEPPPPDSTAAAALAVAGPGPGPGQSENPEVRRQAEELVALAAQVGGRVTTQAEAIARVRDPARELSRTAVASVLLGAARLVEAGNPVDALPALTLTLEATRARWPAERDTPWWWAADAYVEAARLALVEIADGHLFAHAAAVADEQITKLRAGVRTGDDPAELAETLYAAGLLRLSPYVAHTSGLTFASANDLWRDRAARRRAVHPHGAGAVGEPESAEMPPPLEAVGEAVRYLREGAELSRGHERARVLKSLAEALSVLAGLARESGQAATPTAVSYDDEIRAAAREAFDLLDPVRDPLGRLYLLRVLAVLGEVALPDELTGVLPLPLATVRERFGVRDAAGVLAEALGLARHVRRPDLEFRLIEAADRELPSLPGDSYRRARWDSEVHCLPENRVDCPTGPVPPEAAAAHVLAQAEREDWPSDERAATLIHLAAHSRGGGEEHLGRELTTRARDIDLALCARHAAALHYLDGTLAHDAGLRVMVRAASGERPAPPAPPDPADLAAPPDPAAYGHEALAARHFGMAAESYALCGQTGLALTSLDAGLEAVLAADGTGAGPAAAALLPGSVWLRGGLDEGVGWKLRDLYQLLTLKLSGYPALSFGLMALLHQAAKGVDLTLLSDRPGPFTPSARLARMLAHVAAQEARLPGPVSEPELPGPDDAMLFYVGTGEAETGGDPETEHRNTLRAADRWISQELLAGAAGRGNPLLFPDELCPLLPEDTVLLSLYLGYVPRADGTGAASSVSGLAVTREGLEHHTVRLGDVDAGIYRFTREGHVLSAHPLMFDVSELRRAVVAEPLHRPVSRMAQTQLRDQSGLLLAGYAEALDGWRAAGKRHLCIWPNGPLHYVPFHLLEVNGRPLAEDWTVTQLPSLGFLRTPPSPVRRPPTPRGLVAFASATGGTPHGRPAQDALEPHAAGVAAAMGGHAVLGAAATPRRLLAELADARYVHIAAHGAHNEWAPWYQCLFLSPDADNDGRLFAHDVLRADLRGVELVTMSSCESALGRFDVNDNLRGLPAAFLAAGASAVVGCLWPVHPQVATDFFGTLYERLARHPDRRAAFRDAQTTTRARHPAYRDWGAFCLIGDWRSPDDATHGAPS
ncbi:CHAT domain-containing protein [Streptomyces sp. NPDC021224]|uniref:CHAT domain-containing protein n=1 Tax=unclassified Streptomyces TaxID=2593676 RepID=UPI0037A9C995